jgi:hypothetical protein
MKTAGALVPLEALADLEAVDARHLDVQQNQQWRPGSRRVDGHLPGFGRTDPIAFRLQQTGEQAQIRDLVVDDEDVVLRSHLTSSSSSRMRTVLSEGDHIPCRSHSIAAAPDQAESIPADSDSPALT